MFVSLGTQVGINDDMTKMCDVTTQHFKIFLERSEYNFSFPKCDEILEAGPAWIALLGECQIRPGFQAAQEVFKSVAVIGQMVSQAKGLKVL